MLHNFSCHLSRNARDILHMVILGCSLQRYGISLQLLQNVEQGATFCNCCVPKKVAIQVPQRTCHTMQFTCNLSRNAIGKQIGKKIASCSTSFTSSFNHLELDLLTVEITIVDCELAIYQSLDIKFSSFLFSTFYVSEMYFLPNP